jgi:hypothetical protein
VPAAPVAPAVPALPPPVPGVLDDDPPPHPATTIDSNDNEATTAEVRERRIGHLQERPAVYLYSCGAG